MPVKRNCVWRTAAADHRDDNNSCDDIVAVVVVDDYCKSAGVVVDSVNRR